MSPRYKKPDLKNALSILDASVKDMEFTLSMKPSESSGSTIIRNIYECFRMLGEASLLSRGVVAQDHVMAMDELLHFNVPTTRPINVIENLRSLRHNINYYGYRPNLSEVRDAISIAESCFDPLANEMKKRLGL